MGCWSVGGDYFGSIEDTNSIRCIKTNNEAVFLFQKGSDKLIIQSFLLFPHKKKQQLYYNPYEYSAAYF